MHRKHLCLTWACCFYSSKFRDFRKSNISSETLIILDQSQKLGDLRGSSFCAEKELEEKDYLSLLLPEGLLDFFKVIKAALRDCAYHIYLEELNIHPEHLQGAKLTSKGFYDEMSIQDFCIHPSNPVSKLCDFKLMVFWAGVHEFFVY